LNLVNPDSFLASSAFVTGLPRDYVIDLADCILGFGYVQVSIDMILSEHIVTNRVRLADMARLSPQHL